jgi:hypothetical protein
MGMVVAQTQTMASSSRVVLAPPGTGEVFRLKASAIRVPEARNGRIEWFQPTSYLMRRSFSVAVTMISPDPLSSARAEGAGR